MNADRLLEHYELIAEAPDAIAQLRRFILDLAVRGKLVPQGAGDEPASELLKRITRERVVRGKREKELPEINAEEVGELPTGWSAVPLIALGKWAIGSGFPKNEQGASDGPYFFLKVSDMNLPENAKFITTANNFIDDAAAKRMRAAIHPPGTIIFPKIGGAIATNKRRILTRGSAIDNNCLGISFSSAIDNEWAYFLLTTLDFTLYQAGTAVPALQQGSLAAIPVALPPLAEQHRIVAKVGELMGLCDRLEAAREGREKVRDRLSAASLARLNAPDSEIFQADACFALEALPALTTRPDQIKALRQTILNLAVRGKLVPQDANDEPASELLKRVASEKKRQGVKHSVIPLKDDEVPFELPSGWSWTCVGEICSKTGSGSTPRGGKDVYKQSGIPFLRSQNVYNDGLRLDDVAFIDAPTHARMKGTRVLPGDLLLNITGGSMGRCGRVPHDFGDANISQHVAIIRPAVSGMEAFLHSLVLSPYFQAFIFNEQTGAGRGGLPKNRMDKIAVALPPLAEQHRIVAKVYALMALCDRLEAALTTADTTRRRLLDVLLAEALLPSDDREMEAAE